MSNPGSGPITAQSIAGQMGGLGGGSSAAPVTGYPAPDMAFAPPQDSSGSTYYSSTNPFSVAADGGGSSDVSTTASGGPAMRRVPLPDMDPRISQQFGAYVA